MLPDLDGYELAARLRARFGKEIRIIALSGLPRNNDRAEASNFDTWLEKPWTCPSWKTCWVPLGKRRDNAGRQSRASSGRSDTVQDSRARSFRYCATMR